MNGELKIIDRNKYVGAIVKRYLTIRLHEERQKK